MLILASSSPRRHELMLMLGFDFTVVKPDVDETYIDEFPLDYVKRLATEKAQVILHNRSNDKDIIIAADTTVVIDNQILNKPIDRADAMQMLRMLSNKTHQVLTGFCVASADNIVTQVVTSNVTFRELTEIEIDTYCATGEPDDKAGAYAIQGIGSMFIAKLDGSYSAVMGLPMFELCEVLRTFGISPLSSPKREVA